MQLNRETWVVAGVVLVGLAILAALAWGVWEQVEQLRCIEAAEAELMPLVAREKEWHEQLLLELEHVSSPGYAEEWARVYPGMAGTGEVPMVVSLPEEAVGSASVVSPAPEEAPDSIWLRLWQWLSGDEG